MRLDHDTLKAAIVVAVDVETELLKSGNGAGAKAAQQVVFALLDLLDSGEIDYQVGEALQVVRHVRIARDVTRNWPA
jgi:hypothetical protein